MKNTKLNVLSVSGLLAAAMFSSGVFAGPTPSEPNATGSATQGSWVTDTIYIDPTTKTLKAGESFHWHEQQTVYVCRIYTPFGYLPGKLISDPDRTDECHSAYNGARVTNAVYDVLEKPSNSGYYYQWADYKSDVANYGRYSNKMVQGGTEYGRKLYICRSKYYSDTVVGKYVPEHQACYFEYNGAEHHYLADVWYTQFDVLVQPSYNQSGGDTLPGGGDIIIPDGGGDIFPDGNGNGDMF